MRAVFAAAVVFLGVTALAEPVVTGPEKGALVIAGGGRAMGTGEKYDLTTLERIGKPKPTEP